MEVSGKDRSNGGVTSQQGKLPFDHDDIRRLLSKVKTGVFIMPTTLPEAIKDLLWKMLCVDPNKRITIEMIKAHPALQLAAPGGAPIFYPSPLPAEVSPSLPPSRAAARGCSHTPLSLSLF